MRVSVCSDLHLEFGDLELPGGDVLILSGDVCESRTLRRHKYDPINLSDTHGTSKRLDRAARFFQEECAKYKDVIYVMGNHEHYHSQFHKTWHELHAEVPDNVHVLEQEHVIINDVLFMGATLWTDMNKGDPLTLHATKSMMSDYQAITFKDPVHNVYRKLDPKDTARVHRETMAWFKFMCEEHRDKKIVVVTHHAPTFQSVNEHYKHDTLMNGAYASDLSEFILNQENILFWTHGHMHDPCDYMVGQCRVICNPRGYVGYETRVNHFDPTVGFDI